MTGTKDLLGLTLKDGDKDTDSPTSNIRKKKKKSDRPLDLSLWLNVQIERNRPSKVEQKNGAVGLWSSTRVLILTWWEAQGTGDKSPTRPWTSSVLPDKGRARPTSHSTLTAKVTLPLIAGLPPGLYVKKGSHWKVESMAPRETPLNTNRCHFVILPVMALACWWQDSLFLASSFGELMSQNRVLK